MTDSDSTFIQYITCSRVLGFKVKELRAEVKILIAQMTALRAELKTATK